MFRTWKRDYLGVALTEISPPYPESWCKRLLSKLFPKVIWSMPGCEILEWNIQLDHVHMLMVIPPNYAVSDVIGQMKQYTASKLREKFAWLDKVYWKERLVEFTGRLSLAQFLEETTNKGNFISYCSFSG